MIEPRGSIPRTQPIGAVLRIVVCAGAGLIVASCSGERVIDVNQRIHHDDFEYTVTAYAVTDTIGSGATRTGAAGKFYVVSFRVENRAKRAGHTWDNSIAYLVDEQGRSYDNLAEVQSLLTMGERFTSAPRHMTPAGETESKKLVFDIPVSVKQPYLKVRGELLIGDLFDGKAFEKTKVRLF